MSKVSGRGRYVFSELQFNSEGRLLMPGYPSLGSLRWCRGEPGEKICVAHVISKKPVRNPKHQRICQYGLKYAWSAENELANSPGMT